jgi:Uma2 family endonuclease
LIVNLAIVGVPKKTSRAAYRTGFVSQNQSQSNQKPFFLMVTVSLRGTIDGPTLIGYRKTMATLTLELPPQKIQTALNLRRWAELLADRELARIEGRIETDRHGHIIMSPPPAPSHGSFQVEISHLLRNLLPHGRVITECPISTADGVKAADVGWASRERMKELGDQVCFPKAPDLCVEVISPGNTKIELQEKMALYFDAGAHEVWLCDQKGAMSFFGQGAKPMSVSGVCPRFPRQIELV